MLTVEVRRLSRVPRDDSEVMSGMNWDQLTLATIATSGSMTNTAPAAAMA